MFGVGHPFELMRCRAFRAGPAPLRPRQELVLRVGDAGDWVKLSSRSGSPVIEWHSRFHLRQDAKRWYPREVTIVGDQGIGVERDRTGGLDGVGKLQAH